MRLQTIVKAILALLIMACFWPAIQGWIIGTNQSIVTMSSNLVGMDWQNAKRTTSRYIVIDTSARTLDLYINDIVVKKYRVAVGTRKTPTPIGDFRVINKDRNWGTGFGSRWMGLNVPWGIFGIHGTNKPWSIGDNASHGCIRMHNPHVEELFTLVPEGTPVIIINSEQLFPRLRGRKLTRGMHGQDVVYLQRRLKEIGLYAEDADGRYGTMTELAVSYFQFLNGSKPTGVVDRQTYEMLRLGVAPEPPK